MAVYAGIFHGSHERFCRRVRDCRACDHAAVSLVGEGDRNRYARAKASVYLYAAAAPQFHGGLDLSGSGKQGARRAVILLAAGAFLYSRRAHSAAASSAARYSERAVRLRFSCVPVRNTLYDILFQTASPLAGTGKGERGVADRSGIKILKDTRIVSM